VYGQRSGRINVNTAPHELLVVLGEALGQQGLADTIEQERQTSPFVNTRDLEGRGIQVPSDEENARPRPFVVSSGAFRIQGNGMAGENKVRIEAFVRRDIQGGPDGFRLLSWREIR
jgi:type II secretory pathway component PulK